MNAIKSFFNGISSMLSETGKISIKRGISGVFSLAMLYIVWFFLEHDIPKEKYDTVKYLFTVLAAMILLLTGVATVKDIIAFKNGQKEEVVVVKDKVEVTHEESSTSQS